MLDLRGFGGGGIRLPHLVAQLVYPDQTDAFLAQTLSV